MSEPGPRGSGSSCFYNFCQHFFSRAQGSCDPLGGPCNPNSATKSDCGEWVAVAHSNWPVNPANPNAHLQTINMTLTRTGRVLMWGERTDRSGWAHYWDPGPETFQSNRLKLTPNDSTFFCGGHAVMGDGRILVVGGQYTPNPLPSNAPVGIPRSALFDPPRPEFGLHPL